jgi:hypothetical protein
VKFNLLFENKDNMPLWVLTYECEKVEIKLYFLALRNRERRVVMVTFSLGLYLWLPLIERPVLPQSSSVHDEKR